MKSIRAAVLIAGFVAACGGGSDKEAKDPSQYDPEQVSEEQNKNEVDPFFEGEQSGKESNKKVDLNDQSGGDKEEQ